MNPNAVILQRIGDLAAIALGPEYRVIVIGADDEYPKLEIDHIDNVNIDVVVWVSKSIVVIRVPYDGSEHIELAMPNAFEIIVSRIVACVQQQLCVPT